MKPFFQCRLGMGVVHVIGGAYGNCIKSLGKQFVHGAMGRYFWMHFSVFSGRILRTAGNCNFGSQVQKLSDMIASYPFCANNSYFHMGGKLEIIFKPAENFNKGYFIPVLNEGAFNLSVLRPGKAVWKIQGVGKKLHAIGSCDNRCCSSQ